MLWFAVAHSFGPKKSFPGKKQALVTNGRFCLGEFGGGLYPIHSPGQIIATSQEFFSHPNGWWIIRDHPLNFREILAPKVFFHGSPENLMIFPRISGISRGRAPIFHLAGGILSLVSTSTPHPMKAQQPLTPVLPELSRRQGGRVDEVKPMAWHTCDFSEIWWGRWKKWFVARNDRSFTKINLHDRRLENWVFKVGLLNVRWSVSLFDHKLAISDKLSE